jgi:predicted transposase YbfD/YdcC
MAPPSRDTIRRVVEDLDAKAADLLVGRWIADRVRGARAGQSTADGGGDPGAVGLAIDGKVVRNSGGGYADVKLFSAMAHGQCVVIAQTLVPDGTNEITCVPALLDPVEVAGAVVTADAAHCQDATAAYLTGRDADYVLTVKGNRKTLLAKVKAGLGQVGLDDLDGVAGADHVQDDRGHGRRVRRAIWLAPADSIDFPGAGQVFRIRREVRDTCGRLVSKEIVHGITSLSAEQAAAATVARFVREHWGIENKVHWVRDVVFGEDTHHAYLGAAAQVMATFRNLAIALIRLSGTSRITQTLERIAADRTRILPLLAASRP